ncbi:unnamed protein product [Linum trigynum]|uniref:Uncharacterized protein n=1 Tax=Linum trigynum TaxID=586398 RepID=A0AAV2GLS5_9ROSI
MVVVEKQVWSSREEELDGGRYGCREKPQHDFIDEGFWSARGRTGGNRSVNNGEVDWFKSFEELGEERCGCRKKTLLETLNTNLRVTDLVES